MHCKVPWIKHCFFIMPGQIATSFELVLVSETDTELKMGGKMGKEELATVDGSADSNI